jgi:glycosyltransferase involved in cell wall biosynthesis
MPRLTIAAATVNSPHWNELFVQSIRKFTKHEQYELLIIDNGSLDIHLKWLREQPDVRIIENAENIGHGGAMDQATREARGKYLAFFDIDSHVQRERWETDLIELYEDSPACRLIGCVGPEHKPLHPPLFFFEPSFIIEHGLTWQYQPGVKHSTDTAQKVYWDIKDLGYDVVRLDKGPKIYAGIDADEIVIGGEPTVLHFWYGSRFQECGVSPKATLDGIDLKDHLSKKKLLFDQPKIQEVLRYGRE